jgi:hypothetical protein
MVQNNLNTKKNLLKYKSMASSILTAFNNHFIDFVDDILSIFPNDKDIATARNSFLMIKKANPKLIIKIWNKYVVSKYQDKIEDGDISFFVNKDYSEDLTNTGNSDKIIQAIDRLRNPVKMMNSEDQQKTMKYIQNLTKLSNMYEK